MAFTKEEKITIVGTCKWCDGPTLHGPTLIPDDDECDGCWELRHRIWLSPEMAQRMLDALKKQEFQKKKAKLENQLDDVWEEIKSEFRCPHCGLLLDSEADWIGLVTDREGEPDYDTYRCPHCSKICDFPNRDRPNEEGGDSG